MASAKKKAGKGGKKTAKKTASAPMLAKPSPRNGNRLPVGAHPGNTGGKPGRSGRRPNAFIKLCQKYGYKAALQMARKIIPNPEHPHFINAAKTLMEFGYEKPKATVEVSGEVSLVLADKLKQARARAG